MEIVLQSNSPALPVSDRIRNYQPYLLVSGTDQQESLASYEQRGGYSALRTIVEQRTPQEVIDAVTAAGLAGRGGAAFPTGRKWSMIRDANAQTTYVVCNGGEHEPGSHKDRVLMQCYPHAIIEGTLIAAYAVGAKSAVVFITEDQCDALASIRKAIREAGDSGYTRMRSDRTEFACDIECVAGPATYIAGEETAVLNAIEGHDALPRAKPPYPSVSGLHAAPTLVNNVETLASVPAILRNGVKWFRQLGTEGSPGGLLVTLGHGFAKQGVYEVPFGISLAELVSVYGGGTSDGQPVKGILPGGPSLPFISGRQLDVVLDHAALKSAGSGVGCAAMRLWSEGTCMVEVALEIARFFAREQCGLCPMCRMETQTFAHVLGQISTGKVGLNGITQIEKAAKLAHGKGRCSLLAMAGAPVKSAIEIFADDFRYHIENRRCPADTL